MATNAHSDHAAERKDRGTISGTHGVTEVNGEGSVDGSSPGGEAGQDLVPPADTNGVTVVQKKAKDLGEALAIAEDLLPAQERPATPAREFPCEKVSEIVQQLCGVVQNLRSVEGRVNEVMLNLFGEEGFLNRYKNDSPHLKKPLVRQLVSMFFNEPGFCCFIQASTTTVYLGNELVQKGAIPSGCLLYTNSAIMPLTVLREGVDYKVYTFCGPSYDPVCAGWLFPEEDQSTTGELRRLFHRQRAPLTTAFLMPRWVSQDGTLHFERKETAHLARVLTEESRKVVVSVVADRLVEGIPKSEKPVYPVSIAPKSAGHKNDKVCLLIAGEPAGPRIEQWGQSFSVVGFDVHWYDPGSNHWLRYEP